jgi:hypothetical protein
MFTYTQNSKLLNTPSLDDVVKMFLTPSFDLDRETAFEKKDTFLPMDKMIDLAEEYRSTTLRKGEFCQIKSEELKAIGITRAAGTIQNVLQSFVRSMEARK